MKEIKFKVWNHVHNVWCEFVFSKTGNFQYGYLSELDFSKKRMFTGLHDKNNKEIYDGDLVVLFNLKDATFEIINHKGCFGYLISSEFVPLCGHHIRPDVIEIVGNIYQNNN